MRRFAKKKLFIIFEHLPEFIRGHFSFICPYGQFMLKLGPTVLLAHGRASEVDDRPTILTFSCLIYPFKAPIAIGLCRSDPDSNFFSINRSIIAMLVKREEMSNKAFRDPL